MRPASMVRFEEMRKRLIQKIKASRVLEIGSGIRRMSDPMSRRYPSVSNLNRVGRSESSKRKKVGKEGEDRSTKPRSNPISPSGNHPLAPEATTPDGGLTTTSTLK